MNRFHKGRHRRDENHAVIVAALERLGCSVRDCSQLGDNGPDLAVGVFGQTFDVEIKMPGKPLEPEQIEWNDAWRGSIPTTLWSVDQCEAWVNTLRRRLIRGVQL